VTLGDHAAARAESNERFAAISLEGRTKWGIRPLRLAAIRLARQPARRRSVGTELPGPGAVALPGTAKFIP
jgi:hypothetical protein